MRALDHFVTQLRGLAQAGLPALAARYRNLSMKGKLLGLFLGLGLIPLLVSTLIAYAEAQRALDKDLGAADAAIKEEVISQLTAVRDTKRHALELDLKFMQDQIHTFARDLMVIESLPRLSQGFEAFRSDNGIGAAELAALRSELKRFYTQTWAKQYRSLNKGRAPELDDKLTKLQPDAIALQAYYLARNSHELGAKQRLDRAGDGSDYSAAHARLHPILRDYQERFGYHDIFLIDAASSRIVYSVNKGLEFATSLNAGPYAGSHLWQVYQDALQAPAGQATLMDLQPYFPAYDAPSGFMAAAVVAGGKKIGVVVFTLPIQRINDVMSSRSGLGKTGETYLVGPDYLMRSDTFLDRAHHSVVASFLDQEQGQVDTPAVQLALEGKAGAGPLRNYRGDKVLTAYTPVKLGNLTWAMLAEVSEAEAFQAVQAMEAQAGQSKARMLGFGLAVMLLSGGLIVLLSLRLSTLIARPLGRAVSVLKAMAGGDLSQRLDYESGDELGQMAEALNQANAEMAQAMQQIERECAVLSQASRELQSLSLEMSQSADQTTGQIQSIRQSFSHVDLNLQNLSTAASEMVDSIQNIAESASEAASVAVSGVAKSRLTQAKMAILGSSSREISEVTELIGQIAGQTNMLALNATIEAARAGEHGTGFAVVANEVKELAKGVARAADDINEKIQGIQQDTHSTGQEIVEIGLIIDRINDAQTLIASAVEEQTATTSEIRNHLGGVAQNSLAVNATIASVADVVQQTLGTAQHLEEEAERLNRMASGLSELVGRFRLS